VTPQGVQAIVEALITSIVDDVLNGILRGPLTMGDGKPVVDKKLPINSGNGAGLRAIFRQLSRTAQLEQVLTTGLPGSRQTV
jgi:hypothetical protein